MSENHFREGRGEGEARAQHLYAARSLQPASPYEEAFQREAPTSTYDEGQYTPNEPAMSMAPAPMVEPKSVPEAKEPVGISKANLFAYYKPAAGAETKTHAQNAYSSDDQAAFNSARDAEWEYQSAAPSSAPRNIYRPREATWAETARRTVLSADGATDYRVEEDYEQPRRRRRRRHLLRRTFTVLAVLVVLGGGAYLFRDQLSKWVSTLTGGERAAQVPYAVVTTPAPLKGYDAAPAVELAAQARSAIGDISGTLDMEMYAVTDAQVIARNLRSDGKYDFYAFDASDGRLLCYFDSLEARDVVPLPDGNFYVRQSPYLVGANGSALVRLDGIEATINRKLELSPPLSGWATVKSEQGDIVNYINLGGQLLSNLWFARTFPFTGAQTVAYVDTGNPADAEKRYLLYVLGADGSMDKWRAAADMTDVVGAACGLAYLSNGEVYALANTDKPLCITDDASIYLDCVAMVARDGQSGKYGLFVRGEQHYDFDYDSIKPVECEITWAQKRLSGEAGDLTLYAVTDAAYPQPLSHYFELEKDGQKEYVALSTQSSYPILLDDQF